MKKLLALSVITAVILMVSISVGASAWSNAYVDTGVYQQNDGGQGEPGPAQPFN